MNEFTIIVFLPSGSPWNDWNHFHQRGKFLAIAKELKGHACLLCLERPLCPLISTIRYPQKLRRYLAMRGRAQRIMENLYVYIPIVLLHDMIAARLPIVPKFNKKLKSYLIRRELSHLGLNGTPTITWLFHPYQIFDQQILKSDLLVYDCYDAYAEFARLSNKAKSLIQHYERLLLQRANIVFTSSQKLFLEKKKHNKNTFLILNAADDSFFKYKWPKALPLPQDMQGISPPIIGFLGNLMNCIDWKLLDFLAYIRPEWSIVIIGTPVEKLNDPLPKRPNIYYLGRKEHSELPAYLNYFDVGIIPFINNDLTAAINPLKLYEYMAARLPIVSSDLPEVRRFKNIIKIATNKLEFVEAIETLLQADKTLIDNDQKKIAQYHSWQARAIEIVRIIKNNMDRQKKSNPNSIKCFFAT